MHARFNAKFRIILMDRSSVTSSWSNCRFGTHPSGPSKVAVDDKETLLQDFLLVIAKWFLSARSNLKFAVDDNASNSYNDYHHATLINPQAHPEALGSTAYNAESALPYLFKVLSIAKALSVQSHPDKQLAVKLHAARPDVYKDDNHKPEMACALTPFEAMCSFRAPAEIAANVRNVPELRTMIGDELSSRLAAAGDAACAASSPDAASEFRALLRQAYTAFMSQPEAVVKQQTSALEARLTSSSTSTAAGPDGQLSADAAALRLCGQFPGDVGVLSPYLLNLVTLKPGQAIFLGANEPHAYLSGDCVEVMACSDNVVRAGLTPKFKDVQILCDMLTYSTGAPTVLDGEPLDSHTREYPAPVPEFVLQKIAFDAACAEPYTTPAIPSAAVIVVVEGSAHVTCTTAGSAQPTTIAVSEGQVWMQPANVTVTISKADKNLLLFRTHANHRLA